jgi:tetratricopeptide (TPR) repeat protein
MKTTTCIVTAILLFPLPGAEAQTPVPSGTYSITISPRESEASAFAWSMASSRADDKSDAGYGLYKEGYALVLEERYEAARKKFEELLAKFPSSTYADDARYWTAYSLRNTDREKAIEDYKRFIRDHPKSSYYDDAVADLNALQMDMPALARREATYATPPRPARAPAAVAIAPNTRMMVRQLKREMQHMSSVGVVHPFATPFPGWREDEKLDDATRLKMDALYALGEAKEDDNSFSTLRDVALDTRQVRPLREAAMDALSGYTKHDVVSVFVEIARKDTSADIQGFAIDYIGDHGTDKNQRVTVLGDLFRSLPKSRAEQRKSIVYTIADVGNDRAVDFLKKVALADEDYDLRRDAVYYLGSIGGESARSALYEILKSH